MWASAVNLRVPSSFSLASCGALFAGLHLLVNIYHAAYYGTALSWAETVVGTLIVCVAGISGYLAGVIILARDFRTRTILFIAIFGYFVSYSVTNLLGSMITSPWVFVISVFVVTTLITMKIGPRWEGDSD